MKPITVLIERASDGSFSCYIPNDPLPYGLIGVGNTREEAIKDWNLCYEEMKAHFAQEDKPFQKANFEFEIDKASALNYYMQFITLASLSRLTGINKDQLSHYATGHSTPRPSTWQKIVDALQHIGQQFISIA